MTYFKAATLTTTGFFLYLFLSGQTQVKGYVYEDVNKNGKKDKNERGIPKVGVSNSILVTQTDARGFYTLPIGQDNIIFVIKPSNYQVTKYRKHLPLFYYIHKPVGSPTHHT